jgi:hypothetical protein
VGILTIFFKSSIILLLSSPVNSTTMQALRTLETSQLMDMLSKYTIDYTRMLSDGSSQEDYLKCKEAVKAIQLEIELRQNEETVSPDLHNNITTPADIS